MKCPSCGQQNRPGAGFCDKCGATLPQGDQAFNTSSPPQRSAVQPQHPLDAGNTGPGGVGWQPDTPLSQQSSSTPLRSMRPLQPGQKDSIVGEAHNIQHRQEQEARSEILTFRVERYDRDGNRLQPVPVEMRSYSITGFINEGDQVRVSGTWEGGLLRAKRADNATTGAVVEAKTSAGGRVVGLVFLLIIVAGFVFLGFLFITSVIGGHP